MKYRMPSIAYVMFSNDNFIAKHLLGVLDTEEEIHGGNINANATYAACDEMERRGWVKQGHNHDLMKHGITMRIRHLPICKDDGRTVDEMFIGLQPAREIVAKLIAVVRALFHEFEIKEGDFVDGEMASPIIGGVPVKFRGLVTGITDDRKIAIVKIAKPFDECTCYLSRITAQVSGLRKVTDEKAVANLRAALAAEA